MDLMRAVKERAVCSSLGSFGDVRSPDDISSLVVSITFVLGQIELSLLLGRLKGKYREPAVPRRIPGHQISPLPEAT